MKRFVPAMILIAGVTLSAPFVGVIRQQAFAAFPKGAIYALATILAGLALGAVVFAGARVRDRRGPRYAGLTAVFA